MFHVNISWTDTNHHLLTTEKCQSNCVLHPKPPGGAAAINNILQNKVIGYYEAWSARKACHKIVPNNIALDALTQYVCIQNK